MKNISDSERSLIQDIFADLHESVARIDSVGNFLSVNRSFSDHYGYDAHEMIGMSWQETIYQDDLPVAVQAFEEMIKSGRSEIESRGTRKNGAVFLKKVVLMNGINSNEDAPSYFCFIRDITASKLAEASDTNNTDIDSPDQHKYHAIICKYYDAASIAMVITSQDGRWLSFNDSLCQLTGYSRDEMHVKTWLDFTHPEDIAVDFDLQKQLADGEIESYSIEKRYVRKNGSLVNVKVSVASAHNADHEAKSFVYLIEDNSESYRLTDQLAYLTKHDSLTGLVNRNEFERRLQETIELNRLQKFEHALCYIDLDQFKIINDICGHLAGDELLKQLAALLKSRVRNNDTLARLGGDEFGLLMENCDVTHADKVANQIRTTIEDFRFTWQQKKFTVSASVGLVPVRHESGNVQEILSTADAACYAAKDAGRNRVHVYSEHDLIVTKRRDEMLWANRIDHALEHNLFRLYFQKITALQEAADNSEHFEILLRMLSTDGSIITPDCFLPAAERFGYSCRIDRWVMENTLRWFESNTKMLDKLGLCSINLSGQSLGNGEFTNYLLDAMDHGPLPANKICFEITETSAVADIENAVSFIDCMHEKGCRFALDDFGSGVSSFAYLKSLPVDFLKIDGAFIRDVASDSIDLAMVKSINEVGQTMGMKTIAEFVASDEIFKIMQQLGIDYAQGFHIARPEPLQV